MRLESERICLLLILCRRVLIERAGAIRDLGRRLLLGLRWSLESLFRGPAFRGLLLSWLIGALLLELIKLLEGTDLLLLVGLTLRVDIISLGAAVLAENSLEVERLVVRVGGTLVALDFLPAEVLGWRVLLLGGSEVRGPGVLTQVQLRWRHLGDGPARIPPGYGEGIPGQAGLVAARVRAPWLGGLLLIGDDDRLRAGITFLPGD